MTDERFNELLAGPLNHPLTPFLVSRLVRALWFVVTITGVKGTAALESFCADQETSDRIKGGEEVD